MRKFLFAAIALFILCPLESSAQNFIVSTNLADWANFGTANVSAGISLSRRVSIGINAEYNPWTFKFGDSWYYNRHRTFGLTCDIWPWYVNAGWSLKFGIQQKEYAMGGISLFKHDYGDRFGVLPIVEEGNAWGGGVALKYTRILSKNWNLEFGAGIWGGKKWYTRYRCPNCGRRLEEGEKWFVAPYDVSVSLVFVLPLGSESRAERDIEVPYRAKEGR